MLWLPIDFSTFKQENIFFWKKREVFLAKTRKLTTILIQSPIKDRLFFKYLFSKNSQSKIK